jgi:replicative DNA helicase
VQKLSQVLRDRAKEVKRDVQRRASGQVVKTHTPTGLRCVDEEFGGLEIGVLTLVVGGTGIGKSVVMKQLSEGAARGGCGALLYIVEDPRRRTADRYLAETTGIRATDIGKLALDSGEVMRLEQAAQAATWADRVLVHFGPITAEQVLDEVASIKDVGGVPLGLVEVDYAGALDGDDDESLEVRCANTAKALNRIAEDRQMSTVFGAQAASHVIPRGRAQFSQRPGDVSGFRPGLGDAALARRMEQYAKAVWTLHRPGYWKRELGDGSAVDDTLELHIVKNSFGGTGWVPLDFDGATSTIKDRT